MNRVAEIIRAGTDKLGAAGIHNERRESEWIAEFAFGRDRLALYRDARSTIDDETCRRFADLIRRRRDGEPLQYITGTTAFHGLDLHVGPGVLVPRPETEHLVDLALPFCTGVAHVCDLCTGCGAVALALAAAVPDTVRVTGIDISPAALAYAEQNRRLLGLDHVRFARSDLYAALNPDDRFDVVTANPPYVAERCREQLPDTVRKFEPPEALFAGEDGLDMVRRIAAETPARLKPGGQVFCEISPEQARHAVRIFVRRGFVGVRVEKDNARRPRILCCAGSATTDTNGT